MSRDITVLSAHPAFHPQAEGTIPAFAFPAAAGTHLPTTELRRDGRLSRLWCKVAQPRFEPTTARLQVLHPTTQPLALLFRPLRCILWGSGLFYRHKPALKSRSVFLAQTMRPTSIACPASPSTLLHNGASNNSQSTAELHELLPVTV